MRTIIFRTRRLSDVEPSPVDDELAPTPENPPHYSAGGETSATFGPPSHTPAPTHPMMAMQPPQPQAGGEAGYATSQQTGANSWLGTTQQLLGGVGGGAGMPPQGGGMSTEMLSAMMQLLQQQGGAQQVGLLSASH